MNDHKQVMEMRSRWLMFTILILIEQNRCEVSAKCVSVADDIDNDPTEMQRQTTPHPRELFFACTCGYKRAGLL